MARQSTSHEVVAWLESATSLAEYSPKSFGQAIKRFSSFIARQKYYTQNINPSFKMSADKTGIHEAQRPCGVSGGESKEKEQAS
jgi:hypothetical protein